MRSPRDDELMVIVQPRMSRTSAGDCGTLRYDFGARYAASIPTQVNISTIQIRALATMELPADPDVAHMIRGARKGGPGDASISFR
jgi:hypothetical protein